MPAMYVFRDDVGGRISNKRAVVFVLGNLEPNAGDETGVVPIASVEDFALVENDRFALAVLSDVGDERVELLALHQGEQAGEWMEWDLGAHGRLGARFAKRLMARTLKPARLQAPSVVLYATGSLALLRSSARSSALGRQPKLEIRGASRSALFRKNSGVSGMRSFAFMT